MNIFPPRIKKPAKMIVFLKRIQFYKNKLFYNAIFHVILPIRAWKKIIKKRLHHGKNCSKSYMYLLAPLGASNTVTFFLVSTHAWVL